MPEDVEIWLISSVKYKCAILKRNWPDMAIRNNIVAKKTTELVLLFHKKTTKLVFLWPNMSQKDINVLIYFL